MAPTPWPTRPLEGKLIAFSYATIDRSIFTIRITLEADLVEQPLSPCTFNGLLDQRPARSRFHFRLRDHGQSNARVAAGGLSPTHEEA